MKPVVTVLVAALLPTVAAATVAAAALVGAGCNSSGSNCSAAANNAVVLIRAELEREGASEAGDKDVEKERQVKESMLPALKEELVKHCKAEKWNQSVRQCVAEAKSIAALESCDPDKGLSLPAGDKPADDKPADDTDDDKPTGDKPADDKPMGDKPADDKPADDKPVPPGDGSGNE